MKSPFGNPLPLAALEAFCHPDPSHSLSRPRTVVEDGTTFVYAASGYAVIKCHRGMWLESDFDQASPAYLSRMARLPWRLAKQTAPADWRALDDIRGEVYRFHPIQPFHVSTSGKIIRYNLASSPAWRIADADPVRLSFVQLIARLPRCEVFVGPRSNTTNELEHTRFTFAGGCGFIGADKKFKATLETKGSRPWHAFKPVVDRLDGTVKRARKQTTVFQGWGTQTVAEHQSEQAALEERIFIQD